MNPAALTQAGFAPASIASMSVIHGRISAALERWQPKILRLSHAIHADPELSGEEFRAAKRAAVLLRAGAFVPTPCSEGFSRSRACLRTSSSRVFSVVSLGYLMRLCIMLMRVFTKLVLMSESSASVRSHSSS